MSEASLTTVRQALEDAGVPEAVVSSLDEDTLERLYKEGYRLAIKLRAARQVDLERCGLLQADVGLLLTHLAPAGSAVGSTARVEAQDVAAVRSVLETILSLELLAVINDETLRKLYVNGYRSEKALEISQDPTLLAIGLPGVVVDALGVWRKKQAAGIEDEGAVAKLPVKVLSAWQSWRALQLEIWVPRGHLFGKVLEWLVLITKTGSVLVPPCVPWLLAGAGIIFQWRYYTGNAAEANVKAETYGGRVAGLIAEHAAAKEREAEEKARKAAEKAESAMQLAGGEHT